MDSGFTLIVKYGERGFAKKFSNDMTRKELVSFVKAKCIGLYNDKIFLSYDLLGAGELDLADEDDMVTMFRILEESQSGRVHIFVRNVNSDVGTGRCDGVAQGFTEVG